MHDHVKANLISKFLRIHTFGKMELIEFKDLIFPIDYKLCKVAKKKTLR